MKHLALFFHGCSTFFLLLSVKCDKDVVQRKIMERLTANVSKIASQDFDKRILELTNKRND